MRGRGLHGHSARVLTPHPGVPAWARVCRCVTPCVRRVLSVSRSLRGREAAGWGYHPPGPHWQLSSRPPTPCHGQSPLFSAAQQPLPGYFASRLSPGRGSCPPPLPAAADHHHRCCPSPLPTTATHHHCPPRLDESLLHSHRRRGSLSPRLHRRARQVCVPVSHRPVGFPGSRGAAVPCPHPTGVEEGRERRRRLGQRWGRHRREERWGESVA